MRTHQVINYIFNQHLATNGKSFSAAEIAAGTGISESTVRKTLDAISRDTGELHCTKAGRTFYWQPSRAKLVRELRNGRFSITNTTTLL